MDQTEMTSTRTIADTIDIRESAECRPRQSDELGTVHLEEPYSKVASGHTHVNVK